MSDVTLVTLLMSDLVASTSLIERLGDERAAELSARHDRMARDLQRAHGAREIDKTDGFLLLFDRTTRAVLYAIAYHDALAALGEAMGVPLEARVGIHLGEVILRENTPEDIAGGAKPVEVEGIAKPVAARLMSLAAGRQTLLTRGAFDLARRGTVASGAELSWLAHGAYTVRGVDEPLEVYEVGRPGFAPLSPPVDTEKAQRQVDQDTIVGWRPAPGVDLPERPHWVLEERIGGGGFGDVWRAEHKKTRERRVFKFCYDGRRLSALKREVTLVRLLKNELGDRKDIARVIDWNFDTVPYFLESEWTPGGSLDQWLVSQGGVSKVPLATRVEIVAQTASALAAAHSVGVLHKDVKPANILMTGDAVGTAHACLTDFGIGLLTDEARLARAGITAVGITDIPDADSTSAAAAGTRLYMAPELIEGRPATVHADVYALGVMLYQLVIGDLSRALGSGWEGEVEDPVLREDIASAVVANPERRIDVRTLAENLRRIDERRAEHAAGLRARADAVRAAQRRRYAGLAAGALLLFAAATAVQLRRVAAEATRANREAETSRRVSEFMMDLFRLADPGENRGNSVTAREILEVGRRRIAEDSALVDAPAIRAALMGTMANVYLGLGLPAEARPIAEQSLSLRVREFGERSVEAATSEKLLGDVAYGAGDYAGAEQHYRRAVEVRTEKLAVPHADVADAMVGLSASLWRRGRMEEADSIGRAAVAMFRLTGSPTEPLALGLSNLGAVLLSRGRGEEAEPVFREALTLSRAAHGAEDRRVAQIMTNLGFTITSLGRLDEASRISREALALYQKLLGPDHPVTAISTSAVAMLLLQQRNFSEATVLFRNASQVFDTRLGREHPLAQQGRSNLSWALVGAGRCGEAEPIAREAAEGLARTHPPGHWLISQAESILGECLAQRGQREQAELLLTRSYPVIKATQGGFFARAALERVIDFYERTGNAAKAAEYRAMREPA